MVDQEGMRKITVQIEQSFNELETRMKSYTGIYLSILLFYQKIYIYIMHRLWSSWWSLMEDGWLPNIIIHKDVCTVSYKLSIIWWLSASDRKLTAQHFIVYNDSCPMMAPGGIVVYSWTIQKKDVGRTNFSSRLWWWWWAALFLMSHFRMRFLKMSHLQKTPKITQSR